VGRNLFEVFPDVKINGGSESIKNKNLILEADLNLSNEHEAEGIAAKFLPYIHGSKTIKQHFSRSARFLVHCIIFLSTAM